MFNYESLVKGRIFYHNSLGLGVINGFNKNLVIVYLITDKQYHFLDLNLFLNDLDDEKIKDLNLIDCISLNLIEPILFKKDIYEAINTELATKLVFTFWTDNFIRYSINNDAIEEISFEDKILKLKVNGKNSEEISSNYLYLALNQFKKTKITTNTDLNSYIIKDENLFNKTIKNLYKYKYEIKPLENDNYYSIYNRDEGYDTYKRYQYLKTLLKEKNFTELNKIYNEALSRTTYYETNQTKFDKCVLSLCKALNPDSFINVSYYAEEFNKLFYRKNSDDFMDFIFAFVDLNNEYQNLYALLNISLSFRRKFNSRLATLAKSILLENFYKFNFEFIDPQFLVIFMNSLPDYMKPVIFDKFKEETKKEIYFLYPQLIETDFIRYQPKLSENELYQIVTSNNLRYKYSFFIKDFKNYYLTHNLTKEYVNFLCFIKAKNYDRTLEKNSFNKLFIGINDYDFLNDFQDLRIDAEAIFTNFDFIQNNLNLEYFYNFSY